MGACIFLSKAQRFNAKLLFLLHGGKKDNPTFVPTGVWPLLGIIRTFLANDMRGITTFLIVAPYRKIGRFSQISGKK